MKQLVKIFPAILLTACMMLVAGCEKDKTEFGKIRVTNSHTSAITAVLIETKGSAENVVGMNQLNNNERIEPGKHKDFSHAVGALWVAIQTADKKTGIIKIELDADDTVYLEFNVKEE